ncbi:hypothetical protein QWY81_12235 [Polaribacter undariae]|uniref:Uncharacterized protein n=1 Tax=Polaribacter sejongensis TaxID=985043 RepID=A0AAJ1QY98_9FLAO|nr:hypothetical protein [Polaribacter undariae]MDN3620225.1 hypothetical protein [Polaribacter undariae]UWD32626.1 hypothetical protein NQP51_02885 [Polaribacter undariae]
MKNSHSFHIPVMGIGFTIDSPLKVAQFGIDSVISLVDDILVEKMRKIYSEKFEIPYKEISDKVDDFRAKRITSYLDLLHDQTEEKFNQLKNITSEKSKALLDYIHMLPEYSSLKKEFLKLTEEGVDFSKMKDWANKNLSMGSIDVNIMTKIDKGNYLDKELLPIEYNDAHAALRGYSNSKLSSSLILSAGMNPRLYTYMSNFDDFFPDVNGNIKKKIILKVSDYRSAFIQGKFLAKKGLWVSEYRVESGLNCGGHAFATDGFLMGPVLKEFKENKETLISQTQELMQQALKDADRIIPTKGLELKITTQGGVGTGEEHSFLLEEYQLDSVGWGSPFLLVPEATSVDEKTVAQLAEAKEQDLYLSNSSPLGVPFNTLKGNTKDVQRQMLIDKGRPGTSCPNKFIALNHEFKDTGLCTASREYQHLKLKEIDALEISSEEKEERVNKITEKSCICVGLGTSTLILNNISTKKVGDGVSVCPGPNMAYYDKIMSLCDITDHIYGRKNMLTRTDRPNVFVKELSLYITHLQDKVNEAKATIDKKQLRTLTKFKKNLEAGIEYYNELFLAKKDAFKNSKEALLNSLKIEQEKLVLIGLEIENL